MSFLLQTSPSPIPESPSKNNNNIDKNNNDDQHQQKQSGLSTVLCVDSLELDKIDVGVENNRGRSEINDNNSKLSASIQKKNQNDEQQHGAAPRLLRGDAVNFDLYEARLDPTTSVNRIVVLSTAFLSNYSSQALKVLEHLNLHHQEGAGKIAKNEIDDCRL